MSSVLDSPLEALAFDYVSFGLITVVNSLWTWLAVVTAAVSFWRLRPRAVEGSSRFNNSTVLPSNDVVNSSNGCSSFPETSPPITEERPPSSRSVAASVAVRSSSAKFQDDGGLTKGVKFTLYFDEDINGNGVGDEVDMTAAEEEKESGGEDWWESGLRMRTEEKSWYSYQDMTVFNGNVVRLWDCSRAKSSKRCVVW